MTELSKRAAFRLEMVKLIATSNPKKPGSMSYDRFQNYFEVDKTGDYTVADCLDAGVRMDDIIHDRNHGFILVGEEAIKAWEEGEELRQAEELERARALVAAHAKK